jgi:archaellum component FlaF (FlaF/FlaG flagellin family)
VTIGIIAAGLILLAWFWWFAPQAGKAGSLQILGTPVYDNEAQIAKIALRNTGNDVITIYKDGVYVDGKQCTMNDDVKLQPGDSTVITANCDLKVDTRTVDGYINTNYGVFPVTLTVIGS